MTPPDSGQPLLSLSKVNKSFGAVHVLRDVDLEVRLGRVTAMVGDNGAGKIPVTGQDATDTGLQNVLLGTQCMTVYKAIKKEAEAASGLAIALIKGDTAAADALATGKTADSVTGKDVPSVLLVPQAIFNDSVKDVVADGFTTAAKLCTTAELKAACTKYGVA